jgi:hypothetical protein
MEPLNAIQLPEELREPPPRPWAALRHARHQLAGVGYTLLFWAAFLGIGSFYRHVDFVAMLLVVSLAVMPFVLLYQVLGSYAATRFGAVNVWHVVIAGQHVRIRADVPLVKSAVVLVTPETRSGKRRVGVYQPRVGICTSLV